MQTKPKNASPTGDAGLLPRKRAIVLIATAAMALVVTGLIRPYPAAAQTPAQAAPMSTAVPATAQTSVPRDSGGSGNFAFGFLVFDWDPQAPGGVPGFDSWPPGAHR